jgi:hypothetical protein
MCDEHTLVNNSEYELVSNIARSSAQYELVLSFCEGESYKLLSIFECVQERKRANSAARLLHVLRFAEHDRTFLDHHLDRPRRRQGRALSRCNLDARASLCLLWSRFQDDHRACTARASECSTWCNRGERERWEERRRGVRVTRAKGSTQGPLRRAGINNTQLPPPLPPY